MPELSAAAREIQRHYYNVELWERKARKVHGENYEPPKPGETISAQALEIKRAATKNKNRSYWEKKANAI